MIIWFGIMYYALSSDPNEALDICVSGILFDVIRGLVRRIGSALDNDTIEVVDELPPEHRARGEAGDEYSTSAQGTRHGRHHIHPQGIAFCWAKDAGKRNASLSADRGNSTASSIMTAPAASCTGPARLSWASPSSALLL